MVCFFFNIILKGNQMGQSLGFQLPPNFYQFGGQQGPIIIRQHGQPDGMFFQAAPQPTIAAQPGKLLLTFFNFKS